MNKARIRVKMAHYGVGKAPVLLETVGLGSCIGVALYDNINKIGGLVHIMLPKPFKENNSRPAKYAVTGIPLLIKKMVSLGAAKKNLTAKIAGGAHMFATSTFSPELQIGSRNTEAVLAVLNREQISLAGRDTGSDYGRTIILDTSDGKLLVRSYQHDQVIL